MKIVISQADSNEWKFIQKLNIDVFQNDEDHDDDLDLNWPYSKVGIKYYKDLVSGNYGHCFFAKLNNKPVGYIALAIKDFWV